LRVLCVPILFIGIICYLHALCVHRGGKLPFLYKNILWF